jgi:hypothetical protein
MSEPSSRSSSPHGATVSDPAAALVKVTRRALLTGLSVGTASVLVQTRRALASEPDLLSPHLTGPLPFALVLCGFTDMPDLGIPRSTFEDFIAGTGTGGMADYWKDASHGSIDLTGSKVFGWYQMQYSFFQHGGLRRETWTAEARRLARNAGVDLSRFYGVVAVINGNADDSFDGTTNLALGIKANWGQDGWRWCKKCQGLAFGGGSPGICAAGGVHDHSASADYTMALNLPEFPGQEQWRWCRRCAGLAYAGFGPGRCPAGGLHDHTGSGAYKMAMSPAGFPGQEGWRWCRNCQGLAYAGPGVDPGRCPVGGAHDHGPSADYTLSMAKFGFESHLNVGFTAHEMGHTFGLGHAHCAGITPIDGHPETDYCDPWDLMGRGPNFSDATHPFSPVGPELSAVDAYRFGWIPAARIFTAPKAPAPAASVRLAAVSEPGADGHLMARIVRPGHVFTIEYRQRSRWDHNLADDVVVIHELRSPFTVGHQDNWRWCKKCEGLAYAGFDPGPCPAGGRHDHSASGFYGLMFAPSAFSTEPRQNKWRWCNRCQGLAYAGFGPGPCPAGGLHLQTSSLDYSLILNSSSVPGQNNWRWCRKCQGLAFAGSPAPGLCTAGGRHDHTGSGDYTLPNFGADEPFLLRSCRAGESWMNFETGTMVVVDRIDPIAGTATVTIA